MRKKTRRALAIGVALAALIGVGSALAGPLKGTSYVGGLPTSGVAVYHHLHLRIHAHGGEIILSVARSGRTVTARFSTSYPFLYCNESEVLKSQSTSPARISSSGSFTAAIGQRFVPESGPPAITQVIKGRFSGRQVSGSITTLAGGCGGVSNFSATAH